MNAKQQRFQLEAWLREYTLWNRLGVVEGAAEGAAEGEVEGEVEGEAEGEAEGANVDFSGEPGPMSGQIRVWPAVDLGSMPFYGLVMSKGYGTCRVVPFSPFALPATPGEMRVEREPPVQVIQGWNHRIVAGQEVKNSWCAGRLSDADVFKVEMFLAVVSGGGKIGGAVGGEGPALLADQVGPPLVHPLDPRYEYLDDERERVSGVLGEMSFLGGEEGNPLSKAAEPEGEYDA